MDIQMKKGGRAKRLKALKGRICRKGVQPLMDGQNGLLRAEKRFGDQKVTFARKDASATKGRKVE